MTVRRISIFPLTGAIIFPGMQLPPKGHGASQRGNPPLFDVGCLGRIGDVEAMEDGRYNIILEGLQRFTILKELDVTTTFRQVEAELWEEDEAADALSIAERASLEIESRRFADVQGYAVDWGAVGQLDDYSLVNAIAQIAPFDHAAKQALLEARGLSDRADLIVQLMQFFGRHDGSDDRVTLQ
jgi:uncharacterized protein